VSFRIKFSLMSCPFLGVVVDRCLVSFPTRRSSDLGSHAIRPPACLPAPVAAVSRHRLMRLATVAVHLSSRSDLRAGRRHARRPEDRKSTRLNSSHVKISYAVFCVNHKMFGNK